MNDLRNIALSLALAYYKDPPPEQVIEVAEKLLTFLEGPKN